MTNKGLIGVVLLLVAIVAGVFIGNMMFKTKIRDRAIVFEKVIDNNHKELENVHSKVYKTIAGKGQIVSKYSKDLESVLKAYVSGGGDKKAVMSSIREALPTLDASMYKDIMRSVESGHLEFAQIQKKKIDIIGQYEIYLETGYFKPGILMSMGYPRIDLEDYKTVISVGVTKEVMRTKKDVVQKVFD